jgi:protein-tyrosine phosphatase
MDDGSENLEESLLMAQAAVEDGIHTIIATPHHANGRYNNEALAIKQAVEKFNIELEAGQIPLKIVSGQEIRLYSGLIDDLIDKKLLCLHQSKYMLLEFPSDRIPGQIFELLHELRIRNLHAVIAHPERNKEIMLHPDKLFQLIEAGALSQITAQSIAGVLGTKIQSLALDLCRHNLVHFMASDAHNTLTRTVGLSKAYSFVDNRLGREFSQYYQTNATRLLDQSEIISWEPKKKRKKWYHF